jgi:hypothetical protein
MAALHVSPADWSAVQRAARWRLGVRATVRAATVYRVVAQGDDAGEGDSSGTDIDEDEADDVNDAEARGDGTGTPHPRRDADGVLVLGRVVATYVQRLAWPPLAAAVPADMEREKDFGRGTIKDLAAACICGQGGHVELAATVGK